MGRKLPLRRRSRSPATAPGVCTTLGPPYVWHFIMLVYTLVAPHDICDLRLCFFRGRRLQTRLIYPPVREPPVGRVVHGCRCARILSAPGPRGETRRLAPRAPASPLWITCGLRLGAQQPLRPAFSQAETTHHGGSASRREGLIKE